MMSSFSLLATMSRTTRRLQNRMAPTALTVLAVACGLATLAATARPARAVGTERFVLDSEQDLSDGKLEGTAVESSGRVVRGVATERLAIDNAATARALLVTARGQAYVGVGTSGEIFRREGDALKPFAQTDALLVTALVEGPPGILYAATSPHGKVLAIDERGQVETLVTLPDTQHVWALAFDAPRQRLFAATGPNGKLFSIDAAGQAEEYLDTEAEHLMSLAVDARGYAYVGTTDEGLLLEVRAKGKMQVVYDFEGNEITAIALGPSGLAVCENTFPKASKKKNDKPKSPDKSALSNDNPNGDKTESKPKSRTPPNGKPGKGQLWHIGRDGRARHLFESPAEHFTTVAFDGDAILVGLGSEGQIYRIRMDGTHALWADVDERQIGAIAIAAGKLHFATGDGAAYYYQTEHTRPAHWLSKPLDAQFHARFGQLSFRGQGPLSLSTRSGNTAEPDESWSPWSTPQSRPGPVRSPAGRFIQLRAALRDDAQLYAATVYYLPRNQAPEISAVRAAPGASKSRSPTDHHTTTYTIHWNSDAHDGDPLRFRIYYRPEQETTWRPLLREQVRYTKTSYKWNTDSVPDGYYVLRVVASDEMANPEGQAERTDALSEPILIDNHPPHLTPLRLQRGRVVGEVRDSQGPISFLQYKVDQEPWKPLRPLDDMLDTPRERFALPLPEGLQPGTHVIAIRATDARHNLVSRELTVTIR